MLSKIIFRSKQKTVYRIIIKTAYVKHEKANYEGKFNTKLTIRAWRKIKYNNASI